MDTVQQDRPLGELMRDLSRETSELIRKEVQLATTEIGDKAAAAGRQAKLIGLGGALAMTGLIVVAAALVIALGHVMPYALAALLVGIALLAGGYFVAQGAMKKVTNIEPKPRLALQTMKENKIWLKEQLR